LDERPFKEIWGEGRDLNPHRPGSRPGALPLSYRHQSNNNRPPRPRPCAVASRLYGGRGLTPGCLRFDGLHEDGHQAPARNPPRRPEPPGTRSLRSGGMGCARQGGFRPSRSGGEAAPLSTVRIVREPHGWRLVHLGCAAVHHGRRGQTKTPGKPSRPAGGFRDAGDPLHLCWVRQACDLPPAGVSVAFNA
jgi:hypothetical protein